MHIPVLHDQTILSSCTQHISDADELHAGLRGGQYMCHVPRQTGGRRQYLSQCMDPSQAPCLHVDRAAERALHVACYQCGHPSHWRAAAGYCFQPILCAICTDGFQLGRASHRLLSKTEAIFRRDERSVRFIAG